MRPPSLRTVGSERSAAGTLLLLATLALWAGDAAAQADTDFEQSVRELLGYTELSSIAEQVEAGLTQQVVLLSPELSEERQASVRDALREELSASAMGEDVTAFLVEAGDPATVAELLDWLATGATAELEAVREAHEPSLTLEEYAANLEADLPAEARVRAVAGWAQTQQAALFYLAVQEAQRAAAHTIAKAVDEDAPTYQPPTRVQVGEALEAYFGLAVVTFLWSLEPAPNELIERATEEYSSASGQWFVESYSAAVAESIERAAERVAARVGG